MQQSQSSICIKPSIEMYLSSPDLRLGYLACLHAPILAMGWLFTHLFTLLDHPLFFYTPDVSIDFPLTM